MVLSFSRKRPIVTYLGQWSIPEMVDTPHTREHARWEEGQRRKKSLVICESHASRLRVCMEALPINPSPAPLRVGAIIQEACRFAWIQRHVLWPWIVLGAVLGGLAGFIGLLGEMKIEERGTSALADVFPIISFVGAICSGLVFVLLAVFCHRSVLLPHLRDSSKLKFFFTSRERKFFAWVLGVYFVVGVSVALSGLVLALVGRIGGDMFLVLGPLILAGLFFYLLGRWSLVFPSIALDLSMDIGWSWKQTRGNGWQMFVLVGFLPLTTVILGYLLSYAVPSHFSVVHSFLQSFAYFIFTPVEVAVLSIAF